MPTSINKWGSGGKAVSSLQDKSLGAHLEPRTQTPRTPILYPPLNPGGGVHVGLTRGHSLLRPPVVGGGGGVRRP